MRFLGVLTQSRTTIQSYAVHSLQLILWHLLVSNLFGYLRGYRSVGGREVVAACALALCQSLSGAEHVFRGGTDVIVQC